jgi:hypothetical protein
MVVIQENVLVVRKYTNKDVKQRCLELTLKWLCNNNHNNKSDKNKIDVYTHIGRQNTIVAKW